MEPMKVRNYRLPGILVDELRKISIKEGVREPELVRTALREFIDRKLRGPDTFVDKLKDILVKEGIKEPELVRAVLREYLDGKRDYSAP